MDLFQRFALGEIDAFETLVRQSQGDSYAWIVRIVRDPGIAEDLTVETLWRAVFGADWADAPADRGSGRSGGRHAPASGRSGRIG